MYFFHADNFSTPILLSRNFAERGRFPSGGDVSTEIPIGGLFLQNRIELKNETEFWTLFLLTTTERLIGSV
jgi:hypothetical protein